MKSIWKWKTIKDVRIICFVSINSISSNCKTVFSLTNCFWANQKNIYTKCVCVCGGGQQTEEQGGGGGGSPHSGTYTQ